MRIDENHNNLNTSPVEQSSTPSENKENKLSLFNMLNKEEKTAIDENKDGKISFQEVKNYINSGVADSKILNKLASMLGIEIKYPLELSTNPEFKRNANEILDVIEKIDINNDDEISLQEIKNAQNLTKSESVKLHKAFGLVDGNFENQQGRFGSCWALSGAYGIFITDKEKFSQIVKQDEDGNAVVTFYGISGKHFETKIDRRIIQSVVKMRTEIVNYNTLNKHNGIQNLRKYYSSDPDAIAIELAFANYDSYIKQLKEEQVNKMLEYVNNSTPVAPDKPDITKISLDMSDEDLVNFLNYYRNSTCEDRDSYIFPYDVNYLTSETVENMKKYIQTSTPVAPEKPTEREIYYNLNSLSNYLNNSTSETIRKPEINLYLNNAGTIEHGGQAGPAIKLMAGGTYNTYYGKEYNSKTQQYEEVSSEQQDEIENLLKNFKKNDKVYSISFSEGDSQVFSNHGYTIVRSDEKNIYLVNPHDTTVEPVVYSIKRAIKNLDMLQINTLPKE